MVDMEAYRLMHGRDDDPPRQSELTEDVLGNDEIPEGPFALLLPATINGYGFHNKKWSRQIEILRRANTKNTNRCATRRTHRCHQMEQRGF
jgi:hypothetical protein